MTMSNIRKHRFKKHAGRPNTAAIKSPTAHAVALIRSSAIGIAGSLGIALLFLLLAASRLRHADDPIAYTFPIAIGILYLASLLGGLLTTLLSKASPWLCGAISGGELILLCSLLRCTLPYSGTQQIISSFFSQLPILPLAVIGAWIGRKRPRSSVHLRRTQHH